MDKKAYQSILDMAIQAEIEANLFYHQVAEKVKDAYLHEMFLRFAREELKHRTILEGFRNNEKAALSFARVQNFQIAETVDEPSLSIEMKPADAIALAMKKSRPPCSSTPVLPRPAPTPNRQKSSLNWPRWNAIIKPTWRPPLWTSDIPKCGKVC